MDVQSQWQLGPSTRVDSPAAPVAAADARYSLNYHYDLHHPHPLLQQNGYYHVDSSAPTPKMRKRKAESQDNERLSKRLSLLNLEKNGQKLYVPVEGPSLQSVPETSYNPPPSSSSRVTSTATANEDGMQIDDTKHKVYIYDLDAELSSADENSESEYSLPGSPTSGRGRLIFLPDIEKHLSRTRIPPAVFANSDGELAGHNINDMQMVLYSDSEPSSLTVPREQDSVRKAILEARARLRQKQRDNQKETEQGMHQPNMAMSITASSPGNLQNFGHASGINMAMNGFANPTYAPNPAQKATSWPEALVVDEDLDAMDTD
ncbi:hypothetical protein HD806DRAFT_56832 [Xylariaceae sp. AK1471]|nr:hypothetical protein HD806DRAFT_56832 [Xylariaceae sp. AK1471]